MSKWIKTSEQKPTDWEKVLAWWEGRIMAGSYSLITDVFDLGDDLGVEAVTASVVPYWRPLPKPPKEETDAKG